MAWVGDHIFSYGQAYAAAMCVCCPESSETVVEDRREIGPTYFFAPPRVFENLLTQVMVRMEDAGWLMQHMFKYFLGVAQRCGAQILDGKPVGAWDRLLYSLGDLLVYAPLLRRMGFSRTRVAYTAGEAIGPELFRFYRSLGVNLKQLYGQTEASVRHHAARRRGLFRHGGQAGAGRPDQDRRVARCCSKSPGVFLQYYKNDAATKETKTPDG
jgi:long-chain acyl-CoA synthetase